MKRSVWGVATAVLAGCATVTEPVPADYKGPTATIEDSCALESSGKGQFFVVSEIDGQRIRSSLAATGSASYGRGFSLTIACIGRKVPATRMKLKLRATHATAAPIHEMASRAAGTFFGTEATVDFEPQPGRFYYVRGSLAKDRSCVWIEESPSNAAVTDKSCGN
jgi:hypothetical protein